MPRKRRAKRISPTKHTLARLKWLGYYATVVEYWNHWARRRHDLYGFMDVVAIRDDRMGVLGIQCTSRSNMLARVKKILALDVARIWIMAGNRIQVWGYDLFHGRYRLKKRIIRLGDF